MDRKGTLLKILLCCVALLLAGCADSSEKQSSNNQVVNKESPNKGERKDVETQQILEYTIIRVDHIKNKILVKELIADEEKASITLPEYSFAYEDQIFKLEDSFAIILNYGDSKVTMSEVSGVKMLQYPDKIEKKVLQFYDRKLNLIKEIGLDEIVDIADRLDEIAGVDITKDGQKIAFNFTEDIYLYDIEEHTGKFFIGEKEKEIFFDKISFSGNTNLAYYGSNAKSGEYGTAYGVMNLETMDYDVKIAKDFRASDLIVSNENFVLTDAVDPYKNYTSSGKVILYQLGSGKSSEFKVDGNESTMACISNNGLHLFTARDNDNKSYLLRQYDIQSGEILKDKEVTFESSSKPYRVIQLDDERAGFIFTGDENRLFFEQL